MPTSRNHMTLLSAACAALGVAAAVHADCTDGYDFIIRVDDGCSWETAFNDLQDALDAAYDAPTAWHIRIRIADGVCTPGLGQRTDSFVIDTPRRQSGVWLQITGAFAGSPDITNATWVWSGIPDGAVNSVGLNLLAHRWMRHLTLADVNTAGVPSGDSGYGMPDGRFTGADLYYFVNHWLQGCD